MRRCHIGRGLGGLLGLVALAVAGAGPARGDAAITLAPGRAAFWDGGFVTGTDAEPREFGLRLAGGGHRLRVAIDTPSREDTFDVAVVDPSGAVVASTSNRNQFNAEAFVDEPVAGGWTVRVTPAGATDAPFRMRARLDDGPEPKPDGHVAMLPNLKAVPPYEFGFIAPANPLNAVYPPDTVNPPLDVAGVHPLSCALDESAPVELGGGGASVCLRLTSGPINVGRGPFDMRFDLVGDTLASEARLETNTVRGPAEQAVHYSDGAVELRPAGTYSFHTTHAHFHTDQILTYELFAVTDAIAGGLTPAGAGTKSGFCPADQLFGEWRKFTQRPAGTFGEGDSAAGGNCFSPSNGVIGLSTGWGDVYRWQRPGQYVEFGGNGDGRYVVRTTVDKGDHVVEANDADNAAYAYIEVIGETVTILERGQGSDPWDPAKVVFRGKGPASVDDVGGELAEVLGGSVVVPASEDAASAAAPPSAPSTLPVTGGAAPLLAPALLALALVGRRVAAS